MGNVRIYVAIILLIISVQQLMHIIKNQLLKAEDITFITRSNLKPSTYRVVKVSQDPGAQPWLLTRESPNKPRALAAHCNQGPACSGQPL